MKHTVPFYPNTKDNTHCFQAGIRMILKYFYPNEEYTWRELDEITAKEKGMWTWPMAGYTWMKIKGIDIVMIEVFDYQKFANEGLRYMEQIYGSKVAEEQNKHCNIPNEQIRARKFSEIINIEKRLPDFDDIRSLLDKNYLVGISLNSHALDNKPGYAGHFVVVFGYDKNYLYLHNPGLPPKDSQKVSNKQFEKAWAYPDEKAKNAAGFRK